jgi:hypothetical protein
MNYCPLLKVKLLKKQTPQKIEITLIKARKRVGVNSFSGL